METDYAKFMSHMAKLVEAAETWERLRRVVLPAFGLRWCMPADEATTALLKIADEYHSLKAKETR